MYSPFPCTFKLEMVQKQNICAYHNLHRFCKCVWILSELYASNTCQEGWRNLYNLKCRDENNPCPSVTSHPSGSAAIKVVMILWSVLRKGSAKLSVNTVCGYIYTCNLRRAQTTYQYPPEPQPTSDVCGCVLSVQHLFKCIEYCDAHQGRGVPEQHDAWSQSRFLRG